MIKQHIHDRPKCNVSFSGGKDSTAVLTLARKAGVTEAFFLDTGIEFPETIAFVKSQGVPVIEKAGDFWQAVREGRAPGEGQPVVLQAPEVAPARAPPCGDWRLRHGAGQPVV